MGRERGRVETKGSRNRKPGSAAHQSVVSPGPLSDRTDAMRDLEDRLIIVETQIAGMDAAREKHTQRMDKLRVEIARTVQLLSEKAQVGGFRP